jgi:hypothetical protein
MASVQDYANDARLGTVQRYMTGAETIRLTVFNAASGVTATISGRRFDCDARISEFAHRLTPTTDRVATVLDITPGEGWLLGLAVRVTAGAPKAGQTYAVVEVGNGSGATFTPFDVLVAGTITAAKRVAWPGSPIMGPLETPGALRSIAGSTPAAGAEISETVPTGARWELVAIAAALTSSATVAARHPVIFFDDGATPYFRIGISSTQAASLGLFYNWAQGIGSAALDSAVQFVVPIPAGLQMLAGHRFRTVTTAIQAADQWSGIQYLVREWIEGA